MADDQLTDEEREHLAKFRAERSKSSRKVTVRGKHASGADYEFDVDGPDAERIIARHSDLWAEPEGDGKPPAKRSAAPFGGKRSGGT
jgi:hypothetical protein